jgi:hypothetical protein
MVVIAPIPDPVIYLFTDLASAAAAPSHAPDAHRLEWTQDPRVGTTTD